ARLNFCVFPVRLVLRSSGAGNTNPTTVVVSRTRCVGDLVFELRDAANMQMDFFDREVPPELSSELDRDLSLSTSNLRGDNNSAYSSRESSVHEEALESGLMNGLGERLGLGGGQNGE